MCLTLAFHPDGDSCVYSRFIGSEEQNMAVLPDWMIKENIKIEPFELNRWTIVFNGLVCNPLRYPSWVDSKDQVSFVKEIRIQIGL